MLICVATRGRDRCVESRKGGTGQILLRFLNHITVPIFFFFVVRYNALQSGTSKATFIQIMFKHNLFEDDSTSQTIGRLPVPTL